MAHFSGMILTMIRDAVRCYSKAVAPDDEIAIDNMQQNAVHGVWQARVRLKGDPNTYRMLIAPADAPLACDGRNLATYFAEPLGDM